MPDKFYLNKIFLLEATKMAIAFLTFRDCLRVVCERWQIIFPTDFLSVETVRLCFPIVLRRGLRQRFEICENIILQ